VTDLPTISLQPKRIAAFKLALIRAAYRALMPALVRLFLIATPRGRDSRLGDCLAAAILWLV
jgi:hypothetical protein